MLVYTCISLYRVHFNPSPLDFCPHLWGLKVCKNGGCKSVMPEKADSKEAWRLTGCWKSSRAARPNTVIPLTRSLKVRAGSSILGKTPCCYCLSWRALGNGREFRCLGRTLFWQHEQLTLTPGKPKNNKQLCDWMSCHNLVSVAKLMVVTHPSSFSVAYL